MTWVEKAIEDARQAGIDLNLIDLNLALTPEQRAERHDAALEMVQTLRAAGAALYEQSSSTSAKAR